MRLRSLNRIFALVLAAAALVRCGMLGLSASGAAVTGYDMENKTVMIGMAAEQGADFVTAFPDITMEAEKMNLRPAAELEFQEQKEFVSVPLYFQTDYPETLYGNGTVETSGCSITSIAMIATYLTGYEYLPDELAYYFGGRAESNIARMELAAETLGLPYEKPENIDYTIEELKKGKCAIILLNGESDFTSSQHFIVLTGIVEVEAEEAVEGEDPENTEQTPAALEEGTGETQPEEEKEIRILVNDSYAPNYENPKLADGFENGFDPDVFRNSSYEGAWVFDKSAMPEEITRYFEAEPEPADPRYESINLSFAERQLLAKIIWAEARGESPEGQQAVAEVVLNRILSDNFPEDVRDIVFQEGQFRTLGQLAKATPGQAQYQAIENAFYGPYMLPTDVVYFATYETNDNVWGSIGGHIFCYEEDKEMME